jgi:hypothetical protein
VDSPILIYAIFADALVIDEKELSDRQNNYKEEWRRLGFGSWCRM